MKFRRLLSHGVIFGLFCAMMPSAVFAQGRTDYSQENRFLIVVETSSSLRKCTNQVTAAISELFDSEMKGELRPHDTIGVWTYNERLHTEFPMQVWKETNSARIERNVLRYLGEEQYENRGHLDKVLPVIGKVIGNSERLTVIFIFDGKDKIEGTPFDVEINELEKHFAHEFKEKHQPFVTILTARDGKIFNYTVSTPGSIKIPHTALPWPTNTTPVVAVAPAPVAPPAPHKYKEIVMAGEPAPVAPIANSTPVETNQAVGQVQATGPAATNAVEQVAAATVTTAGPATNAGLTNVVAESENNKATNVVAAAAPAMTTPTPPATVAASTPWTQPSVSPAPAAAPTSMRNIPEDTALFVIAGSLLAIACALVWFLLKRTRGVETASLISQSMDRSR